MPAQVQRERWETNEKNCQRLRSGNLREFPKGDVGIEFPGVFLVLGEGFVSNC